MSSLFDMLANAQNGAAMQQLARQFGLSQQQTQDALEALLPAFSQGLKRNAANPYDLGSFLSALASGQHAKYFEDATNAFSPQGVAEGNGILGHLFGSKELSRAVAAHAEQATGIGQDVLKQMLPALATMIMGGLFKQTTGQTTGQTAGQTQAAAGFGGTGNPLQQIIEQMMRQGQQAQPGAQDTAQQRRNAPTDNPFGKILDGIFGGGGQAQQNPLGKIFEDMLGTGLRQPENRARPKPTPQDPQPEKTNPSGRARTPYDELFGDLFETGRKTRDDYQQNVDSIFDQYLQGMKKR